MEAEEGEIDRCKNGALNSAAKYVANLLQVNFPHLIKQSYLSCLSEVANFSRSMRCT